MTGDRIAALVMVILLLACLTVEWWFIGGDARHG